MDVDTVSMASSGFDSQVGPVEDVEQDEELGGKTTSSWHTATLSGLMTAGDKRMLQDHKSVATAWYPRGAGGGGVGRRGLHHLSGIYEDLPPAYDSATPPPPHKYKSITQIITNGLILFICNQIIWLLL